METIRCSEISANICQSTQSHIAQDNNLCSTRHENLTSQTPPWYGVSLEKLNVIHLVKNWSLWPPNIYYNIYKNPSLDLTMSQINIIHMCISCFSEIFDSLEFNIF
jgi:hypothetical protein